MRSWPLEHWIDRIVLEREQALEHWRSIGNPAPFMVPDQWRVFEFARLRFHLLNRLQPRTDFRIRLNNKPDRMGVNEESHHRLDAGNRRRPSRRNDPKDNIFLPGKVA